MTLRLFMVAHHLGWWPATANRPKRMKGPKIMDKLTLVIDNMDGSAFYDGAEGSYEVARILRQWADRFDNDGPLADDTYPIRNTNGGKCGHITVTG